MDSRLEQALEYANYKVTVFQQKENLKLRLENMLTLAHNGGIFRVSDTLISFVDTLLRRDITEVTLIDSRGNPVKVSDLKAFQDEAFTKYFEATNEYQVEFDKLRKARSVKQVTDL